MSEIKIKPTELELYESIQELKKEFQKSRTIEEISYLLATASGLALAVGSAAIIRRLSSGISYISAMILGTYTSTSALVFGASVNEIIKRLRKRGDLEKEIDQAYMEMHLLHSMEEENKALVTPSLVDHVEIRNYYCHKHTCSDGTVVVTQSDDYKRFGTQIYLPGSSEEQQPDIVIGSYPVITYAPGVLNRKKRLELILGTKTFDRAELQYYTFYCIKLMKHLKSLGVNI